MRGFVPGQAIPGQAIQVPNRKKKTEYPLLFARISTKYQRATVIANCEELSEQIIPTHSILLTVCS